MKKILGLQAPIELTSPTSFCQGGDTFGVADDDAENIIADDDYIADIRDAHRAWDPGHTGLKPYFIGLQDFVFEMLLRVVFKFISL